MQMPYEKPVPDWIEKACNSYLQQVTYCNSLKHKRRKKIKESMWLEMLTDYAVAAGR